MPLTPQNMYKRRLILSDVEATRRKPVPPGLADPHHPCRPPALSAAASFWLWDGRMWGCSFLGRGSEFLKGHASQLGGLQERRVNG